MFALAIELLTGRYVATAYNDRDQAEWPPHPARLFSALVATWADGDPDSAEGREELAALLWLEQLPPPVIHATPTAHAGLRDVVPVFVPVNDASIVGTPDRSKLDAALSAASSATDAKARAKADKDIAKLRQKLVDDTRRVTAAPAKVGKSEPQAAARLLPEWRTRQPRTFPCATPEESTVVFAWRDEGAGAPGLCALERLCARVVRLGHSSAPVAIRIATPTVVEEVMARTTPFLPDEGRGDTVIRWVSSGQVDRLMAAFALHEETEPRVLPARFVRYAEGARAAVQPSPQSCFERELIVFARVGGPRLSTLSTVGVSQQFRRALMAAAEQPVSNLLSGHQSDGSPSDRPHVAVVPLPSVGHFHADGAILGVALVLPALCEDRERRAVLKAIARLEEQSPKAEAGEPPVIRLLLGKTGTLELERIAWGESSRKGLRSSHWARESRWWASATPVALDRNPGDLHDRDVHKRRAAFDAAAECVRTALGRVAPEAAQLLCEVDVVRSCVLPGTAKPREFPRFPIDRDRTQRVLVHVRLAFSAPVRGPLLLGAGRYQGLGLFQPIHIQTPGVSS